MGSISHAETLGAVPVSQAVLRLRIGRLCHLIRAMAVLWAGWMVVAITWMWTDPVRITENIGHVLRTDLSGATNAQYVAAIVATLAGWTPDMAVSYCVWRLFATYLQGRILTADSAAWMWASASPESSRCSPPSWHGG